MLMEDWGQSVCVIVWLSCRPTEWMGTHLSAAISCQASPHFKLNSAQREKDRKEREKKRETGKKREKCNIIEHVWICSNMFAGVLASWTEIANVEHLLQLSSIHDFKQGGYISLFKKGYGEKALYTPSAKLRKQSLVTLSRWATMTHCLLASLDVFTICSQSCQPRRHQSFMMFVTFPKFPMVMNSHDS